MKHLLFLVFVFGSVSNALKFYHQRRRKNGRLQMAASLDKVDSNRLQLARLRLAEAQGIP